MADDYRGKVAIVRGEEPLLELRELLWRHLSQAAKVVCSLQRAPTAQGFGGWEVGLGVEIMVEDSGELCAVVLPVPSRRVVLEALNPVTIEFVNNGVDAITLQPTIALGARVPEGSLGAAFREPGMLAE